MYSEQHQQHDERDTAADRKDLENAQAGPDSSRMAMAITENDSNAPIIQRTTRMSWEL